MTKEKVYYSRTDVSEEVLQLRAPNDNRLSHAKFSRGVEGLLAAYKIVIV